MAKFSVVIAVYNKEGFLRQTIQSVLAQTFEDFEIIIVNDGSTDTSEQIIKSFNDPRINYYYQENAGAGAARNAAISMTTSKYIALLDADDYWDQGYLQCINLLVKTYPEERVFAVACRIENRKKTSAPVYSIANLQPNETRVLDFFDSSYINSILTSSSTVLHHSVFNKIGVYNPKIKSGQDTDLWIRIGLYYKVVFKNTPYATYNYSPSSLSNTTFNINEKIDLYPYKQFENKHSSLQKFLDLNHFSIAILAKKTGNIEGFEKHFKEINQENLNKKQRFLLNASPLMLKSLALMKRVLETLGLPLSAFK